MGGSELKLGREAHERHEWAAAHEQLHRARTTGHLSGR